MNSIKNIKVKVGDDATIVCHPGEANMYMTPSWTINGSYYSSESVAVELDDYSLTDVNTLYIQEAKLWMDNTRFGCYFPIDDSEVHLAILEVTFGEYSYIFILEWWYKISLQ